MDKKDNSQENNISYFFTKKKASFHQLFKSLYDFLECPTKLKKFNIPDLFMVSVERT